MLHLESPIKDIEMNKELARTLTVALVSYLDENRPEGTMDCSSGECVSLEKAFIEGNFESVEALINKKLSRLTEFEVSLRQIIEETLSDEVPNGSGGTMSWAVALSGDDIKKLAPKVLALAKKELMSYADERNPAIEAIAELEKTFESNPEKLPQWLKNKLAKKHLEGYIMGKEEAKGFNPPAINVPAWNPPCYYGGPCINPFGDCIDCPRRFSSGETITTPNTASGTSTLKAEG